MTATQQVYTVTERTDGLPGFSAYAGDGLHWIASASPHTGNYAEPGSWFVMLGLDATGTIGCPPGMAFTVGDEEYARQWVDVLARMYLADPADPS
ncbi:hypothetical protein [Mycolicibacterium fluoranthenivorans]|uniref:Uncharacterized protein n=1 Tax=Mycolicibacterium fluoranthenivorans TaxID=258505 RepID=A0A7X5U451_9MYCO|nr:hypothetical protein [Mycolicibacterium fluoranthenivorans]MCV7358457.1 hypothetical protein [Mycolicibacterium fluoranthenivorans]NIH98033.1 hypothetical protein [Mycolicibacterium fluoranthenivorans]